MENTEYTLILQDKLGCSITENLFRLLVDTEITVDLPDAFSPNGDGINDVIFVGGLGVEAIERFYVFNRFGQRVFESNETTLGWDGTFNGEPQPIDTYVFRVIAKGFDGHRVERTGTFRLLR